MVQTGQAKVSSICWASDLSRASFYRQQENKENKGTDLFSYPSIFFSISSAYRRLHIIYGDRF